MLNANEKRNEGIGGLQRACLADIGRSRSQDDIDRVVAAFLKDCEAANDVPFLSDLLVNVDHGAQPVLIALANKEMGDVRRPAEKRMVWKIQVLCDEWGNKPQPGEQVEWRVRVGHYRREGIPTSAREISRSMVDGSFSERFEDVSTYTVDDKGCIECGFSAAMHFLSIYGVHPITRHGLSTKPELSGEPSRSPSGAMLHVHYWRYKEMRAADYAALPKIEPTDTAKRGR